MKDTIQQKIAKKRQKQIEQELAETAEKKKSFTIMTLYTPFSGEPKATEIFERMFFETRPAINTFSPSHRSSSELNLCRLNILVNQNRERKFYASRKIKAAHGGS